MRATLGWVFILAGAALSIVAAFCAAYALASSTAGVL